MTQSIESHALLQRAAGGPSAGLHSRMMKPTGATGLGRESKSEAYPSTIAILVPSCCEGTPPQRLNDHPKKGMS
jgi:hypothetical protein